MNLQIHPRNVELNQHLEKLIGRQAGKIRKFLPTFSAEDLDLTVTIEQLPRGHQFQTDLVLNVPQRTIRVEEIEDNPTTSAVRAFHELIRRIKRFKSQLNRERTWRRRPAPKPESVSIEDELETVLNENLEKVENYVRREIFHHVLAATIPAGVIDPHALVDDLFLEVASNETRAPVGVPVEQWLYQRARQHIQERIDQLNEHREEAHIEESAPEETGLEDELLNFYQPDESLRLEDLLKDSNSADPEQLLASEETEQRLQKAVARLPAPVRDSFVLFAVEGFTSDEVAMITGKRPADIVQEVGEARRRLREEMAL